MAGEITITDRAAKKIRAILAAAKEEHGLRVRVIEGGCSGLEYRLDIDTLRAQGLGFSEYFYVPKNIKAVNGLYVSEAAEKKRLEEKQMELYEGGQ